MYDEEYIKWRNLIGEFILEFANVEVEIFGIFEDLGSDQDLNLARGDQFKKRASRAIDLINENIADAKIRKPAVKAINELIKLGDKVRNLIAHNPIQLSLESVLQGGYDHEIRSFRSSENVISFDELLESFKLLVKTRDDLFASTYQIRKMLAWQNEQSRGA